jgi:BirA family biotin operon repressor/biotin-[acetyl-CoA-carboxylase] ligase
MDLEKLNVVLSGLPVNALRYYKRIDSTNTEARKWIDQGAPDFALVCADEQTEGRGRHNRNWFTHPGSSLAFSLVMKPFELAPEPNCAGVNPLDIIPRLTAMGSLAVVQALKENFDLDAQIKWPNDVLLRGRKTAGILAEAFWQGGSLLAVILGIGINVAQESVPLDEELDFPATCVETALGRRISRLKLLRSVIENILMWRRQLAQPVFLKAWEERLAYRDKWVNIIENGSNKHEVTQGLVLGLDDLGRLRLHDQSGQEFSLCMGEIRLRP